jgi:flagellar hook-length control protein FliK
MDLNIFATQAVNKGQALSGSNSALLGSGLLGATLGGTDFWNVILGNLGEVAVDENGKAKTDNKQLGVDSSEVKKEKVDLALLQLALLGQDPDKSIDDQLKELRIERIANNPENRIEQLTKLIDHLTSGLPEVAAANNLSVEELVSRLSQRLEKLEASLEAFRTGDFGDDGAPFQALIATGLNPSQLTKITNRIEEVETKLGRELTVEDLIAGVGNIIPAPGDDDHEFSTTDALEILLNKNENSDDVEVANNNVKTSEKDSVENTKETSEDTQSQYNSQAYVDFMMPVFKAPSKQNQTSLENTARVSQIADQVNTMTNAQKIAPAGLNLNGLQPTQPTETSEAILPLAHSSERPAGRINNAEFNALFNRSNAFSNEYVGNAAVNNGKAMATIKNMASLPSLPQTGDVTLSANWMSQLPAMNIISELAGFDIQSGMPFNSVMQAVAHVTAATAQAGQSHPASSMVAAQVSKAAQNGEARNITLNLDPPELGRVEIRLEFGTEKTVKANLIVEKPETLLLLQRDAGSLEKALQDAGLETSGESLNYEMASEGYDFNSNRDGNAQNGGTGSGADGDADEELDLIETTMTWDVDPETGHVHYSILA